MQISRILDYIDERRLFVPAFQREYVWKRDDAKQLLDSLIKHYPTGTMLTWETNEPPALKGGYQYDQRQGAVLILLDGQQRITTIYMLTRGKIPPYYSEAEIVNDTRGLYLNTETGELEYYLRTKMDPDPAWQNVTNILQRQVKLKDIVRQLEDKGQKVDRALEDKIDDNIRALQGVLDRDFPEQTIPIKASIRDAIDIFYKVNASGVALTEAELALAQISGYWPQARDVFKAKLVELQEQGFTFKLDFLVYILLGCLYHLGTDMRKLHDPANNERLRKTWKRLEGQVLDYVVNLLRTYAFVDHSSELSSPYVLVPIVVYCFEKSGSHLTAVEVAKLVKWFFYAQIRSRYVSQLAQKLDSDLRVVAENRSPFDELLNVIAQDHRLEITADEFIGRAIGHPLFGLMRCYFKSRGAICFTTGVGLRQNAGPKYQLENDHIFPYSVLKRAGYGQENRLKYALAQEMTNRAFLTQTANRSKSDEAASAYLHSVRLGFGHALELQCVPSDENLWRLENYEAFLDSRRKMLANELNGFLNRITEGQQLNIAASLSDLIDSGENDELEFKSSLRWDYKQACLNKKLEDVIVKSITAFANRNGGTLLIGVRDDGEVLGLEHDFASLGVAESEKVDKFELHLRNILHQHLGVSYVATKLGIAFPAIGEKQVCQIEIQPSSKPLFVRLPDKTGQPIERFFVRSGNSSQELTPSEIHSFIAESRVLR